MDMYYTIWDSIAHLARPRVYSSRRSAQQAADRMDARHGSIRYVVIRHDADRQTVQD